MKYVLVRWVDSVSHDGWMTKSQTQTWVDAPGAEQVSVGFLLSKTKKFVVIAQSVQIEPDGHTAALLQIPTPCVISMKTIGNLKWT